MKWIKKSNIAIIVLTLCVLFGIKGNAQAADKVVSSPGVACKSGKYIYYACAPVGIAAFVVKRLCFSEPSETDTGESDGAEETAGVQVSGIQMDSVSEVSASSSLSEYDMTHEPEFLTDGMVKTAWVEGAPGQGIGESVTLYFDEVYQVTGVDIYARYHKSKSLYRKNSRPKEIFVEFSDGSGETFVLKNQFKKQSVRLSRPADTEYMKITMESVYLGSKFEDTVISEIELY